MWQNLAKSNYRKAFNRNDLTLTLSINIPPEVISTRRNKELKIELLPAPVRPTIPIFSAGLVRNDNFLNDGAKPSLPTAKWKINQSKFIFS